MFEASLFWMEVMDKREIFFRFFSTEQVLYQGSHLLQILLKALRKEQCEKDFRSCMGLVSHKWHCFINSDVQYS